MPELSSEHFQPGLIGSGQNLEANCDSIFTSCHFDRRPKAGVEKSGYERQACPILRQMSRLRSI